MSELDTLDAPKDDDLDSEFTKQRVASLHARKRYLKAMLILAALMLICVLITAVTDVMGHSEPIDTVTDMIEGVTVLGFIGVALREIRSSVKEKQVVLLLSRAVDAQEATIEVKTRYIDALMRETATMLQEKLGR